MHISAATLGPVTAAGKKRIVDKKPDDSDFWCNGHMYVHRYAYVRFQGVRLSPLQKNTSIVTNRMRFPPHDCGVTTGPRGPGPLQVAGWPPAGPAGFLRSVNIGV